MSWDFYTLAELISAHGGSIQTGPFGSQLHQHEYVDEGVPVVMPKDIMNGRVNISNIAMVSEDKASRLGRHTLRTGDIVFPRRGDIRKCALIDEEHEGCLCGTGCLKISLPIDQYCPSFLYYYLVLPKTGEWLERNAVGTTMLNLNTSILGNLRVPKISIEKQEALASILSAYDDLIENNRRRIQLLEESARMLYNEWFVQLRFPGHEDADVVDGVPEGWERKTAFEVMNICSGGTPKTKKNEYWDGVIPFFTPKDTTNCAYTYTTEKYITEEGLRNCNSRLYPKNTLFITARGTVGKLNLAQRDMAMNQSCYALISKPPLTQEFLYFSLLSGIEQFRRRAVGTVFDAIICDTFKMIPFLVPQKELVDAYTDYTSGILRQIDVLSMKNRALAQARDLLLPKLMNGEVSV